MTFTGTVKGGNPNSVVGVTFALYADETGGAPLWLETQNVQVDSTGHYTALLGFTKSEGLPIDLFISRQAQWLGVQQDGQAEQPRIMLLSVPYALKAADAETFGGLPPSAYASASPSSTNSTSAVTSLATASAGSQDAENLLVPVSPGGTTNLRSAVAGCGFFCPPTGPTGPTDPRPLELERRTSFPYGRPRAR